MAWAPVPLPATSARFGPVLILGVRGADIVIACDDGQLAFTEFDELKIDLRYDYQTMGWVDVSGFGEDDGHTEEEAPDDGGAQIPGAVPDVD